MTARWTFIALIASTALNLFLLGVAVAVVARGDSRIPDRLPQRPNLRAAASSLPADQRKRFAALLRAEGDSIQGAARQARDLRAGAWNSLASPAFDPTVAKADLARVRAINQASRGKVEDAVVDFAAGLAAPDRTRFGQAMNRRAARQEPGDARERPAQTP
jgi:uncharacterized membrane protein